MKRRGIGAFLALCMLLSALSGAVSAQEHGAHPVCGTRCVHSGSHEELTWTAWEGETLAEGNWYLTQDTTLEQGLEISSGTVRLCLAGHTLDLGEGCLTVTGTASLAICDCGEGGAVTTKGATALDNKGSGAVTIWGGTISAAVTTVSNDSTGTIELWGGVVAASANPQGTGGICNASNDTVRIAGGAVQAYGSEDGSGEGAIYGVYNLSGTVEMTGGVIRATGFYPMGIYCLGGDLILSGGTVEADGAGGMGIYTGGSAVITGGAVRGAGETAVGVYAAGGSITLGGAPSLSAGRGALSVSKDGTVRLDGYTGGAMTVAYRGTGEPEEGTLVFTGVSAANAAKFTLIQPEGWELVHQSEDGTLRLGKIVVGHSITVTADHGTASTDVDSARPGTVVTVTAQPNRGYTLSSITVWDDEGNEIPMTGSTFEMPAADVTVKVSFTASGAVNPFSDVEDGNWYYGGILYVYEHSLMDGVGGGKFDPYGSVTRAMVWTVLARMEGVDTSGGDTWYAKARTWAMISGVSDGTSPTAPVTREQAATMFFRYFDGPGAEGDLSAYKDGDKVSDWAMEAMVWATSEGLITGMGDNLLSPDTGTNRAQLATMLMRFVEDIQG